MKRFNHTWVRALTSACVAVVLTEVSWSQSLTWIGIPGVSVTPFDVSADGSTVVGQYGIYYPSPPPNQTENLRAFRWTAETGVQDLHSLVGGRPENESVATAVSADGSVVVGYVSNERNRNRRPDERLLYAFRWENGAVQLLTPPGARDISAALDVSADGSVVVGWATTNFPTFSAMVHPVRWVDGALQVLEIPDLTRVGQALVVSADGSSVAVEGAVLVNGQPGRRVFVWRNGAVQMLPSPVVDRPAWPTGISADGSVVVGGGSMSRYSSVPYTRFTARHPACRWENGEPSVLNTPEGMRAVAHDVSADGSVVVGAMYYVWIGDFIDDFYYNVRNTRAVRWTQAGIEDLNQTYADLLRDGSILVFAHAVSPDGRYIVGTGFNAATGRQEAFLLDTGFPIRGDVTHSGCVDDEDLLRVLLAFGERGYHNLDVNWDGWVDEADLLEVLFNFGHGCSR
jgi:uncharacterized membrane protein